MSEPSRRQVDAARRAYGRAREKGESPEQAMAEALVAAATLGPVHTPAAANRAIGRMQDLQRQLDAGARPLVCANCEGETFVCGACGIAREP